MAHDNLIFALDIGTRSVIGIAGYQQDDMFHLCCTAREEYKSRVVVDGQIENIAETAKTALLVKNRMECELGHPLQSVYIAAAGRSLQTFDCSAVLAAGEGPITDEFIKKLELAAIEEGYRKANEGGQDNLFFVGHTVRRYLLDDYELGSLSDHEGDVAQVDMIVTFLPKGVVESLYATMRRIGLSVSGLTLEPIAAMNAIVPPDLRKLNIALCDIGAGTSDIAICDKGCVTGYTMATVAGDEITEAVMNACLVDFQAAERMKAELTEPFLHEITYENILGKTCTEKAQDIFDRIVPTVETLAETISERILELNGKPPAALFLVGGGSQTPLLYQYVAAGLSIDPDRVAVGGNVYLKRMVDSQENVFLPEYATPVGIALTAAGQFSTDAFVVTVNNERFHLFNSWDTSVLGILQMSGFRYNQIMGQSGRGISYLLNGVRKTRYGGLPIPAEISLNASPASFSDTVVPGDVLTCIPATPGADAALTLTEATDGAMPFTVTVNGEDFLVGHTVLLNGSEVLPDTPIKSGDEITIDSVCTIEQLRALREDGEECEYFINNIRCSSSYALKPGDTIRMVIRREQTPSLSQAAAANVPSEDIASKAAAIRERLRRERGVAGKPPAAATLLHLTLNGSAIELLPKVDASGYRFVDLMAFTDIDPQNPGGAVVQLLNGVPAAFSDMLKDGDVAELRVSMPQEITV